MGLHEGGFYTLGKGKRKEEGDTLYLTRLHCGNSHKHSERKGNKERKHLEREGLFHKLAELLKNWMPLFTNFESI